MRRLHLLDPELLREDDDRCDDRHGHHKAHDAEELAHEHDADRDQGGVELDGAGHHDGDDEVGLHLVHAHIDRQHQERLAGRIGQREQNRRHGADHDSEVWNDDEQRSQNGEHQSEVEADYRQAYV